jgi:hypothetical protein
MMPEGNSPREQAIRDPLPGLRKQLAEEYRDQPDDRIDEAAKHAVERLGGAKVRGVRSDPRMATRAGTPPSRILTSTRSRRGYAVGQ